MLIALVHRHLLNKVRSLGNRKQKRPFLNHRIKSHVILYQLCFKQFLQILRFLCLLTYNTGRFLGKCLHLRHEHPVFNRERLALLLRRLQFLLDQPHRVKLGFFQHFVNFLVFAEFSVAQLYLVVLDPEVSVLTAKLGALLLEVLNFELELLHQQFGLCLVFSELRDFCC